MSASLSRRLAAQDQCFWLAAHLPSVDSTNLWLRQRQDDLRHGAICVADEQLAGRGRRDRSWHSPAGNLFLSLLLKPSAPAIAAARASLLTMAAGLAVQDTLRGLLPDRSVTLKWPNDVLLEGQKVAGILCEMMPAASMIGAAIVGIGINCVPDQFPNALAPSAVACGLGRDDVAVALLSPLQRHFALAQHDPDALARHYRERLELEGKAVDVTDADGVWRGRVAEITIDGSIILEDQTGTRIELVAGDLTLNALEENHVAGD